MSHGTATEEFRKANALLKRGQHEEALEVYERLLELHASGEDYDFGFAVDRQEILSNKGTALKKTGRYPEAIAAYSLAMEPGGQRVPAILRMRAEANQLNGNLSAAIDDVEGSLSKDPDSNVGLWNAVCYSAMKGDVARVARYLSRFVRLYPEEMDDLVNDPDLESIREDPEFQRVVAELESLTETAEGREPT